MYVWDAREHAECRRVCAFWKRAWSEGIKAKLLELSVLSFVYTIEFSLNIQNLQHWNFWSISNGNKLGMVSYWIYFNANLHLSRSFDIYLMRLITTSNLFSICIEINSAINYFQFTSNRSCTKIPIAVNFVYHWKTRMWLQLRRCSLKISHGVNRPLALNRFVWFCIGKSKKIVKTR